MKLLKILAATGLAGLIVLVRGGMILIIAYSKGAERRVTPLLAVRQNFSAQQFPMPPPPPQAPYRETIRREPRKGYRVSPRTGPVGHGENLWGDQRTQLAIVIDDIGHNMAATRRFLSLKLPLTYSVLPDLKYSRRSARLIAENGGEFLVHLPMEPEDYPSANPGPLPMLLAEGDADTRGRLERYFALLPGAIGASNHMGSAYTRNAGKMQVVQTALAQQGRVFLNSLTSNSKVPRNIARAHGFDYLERNIFLDNDRREGAIRRQLNHALRLARRRGKAIAIGHPYRETRRVLASVFSEASAVARAGEVELVPLSALLRP